MSSLPLMRWHVISVCRQQNGSTWPEVTTIPRIVPNDCTQQPLLLPTNSPQIAHAVLMLPAVYRPCLMTDDPSRYAAGNIAPPTAGRVVCGQD